jgi:NAD(P)-dependent dehydrogenase (short-subunit alcohol dehydrogenase family)
VNLLAPHLLTHLLSAELQGRLLWLGSGLAGSARPQPAAIGRETDPQRAYAESKACDVALALAWNRRLPDVISVAVDPGWSRPSWPALAPPATSARPRTPSPSAGRHPDLASAPYWKNRAPTPVPGPLRDPALHAIFAACDRMVGVG